MHPISERPPTVKLFRTCGLNPDRWQVEVLENRHRQLLLNCCRQSGKSSAVAMLALAEAIWHPMTRVLIISASHRQSRLTFDTMKLYHTMLGAPSKFRVTKDEMELKNMSRSVCRAGREATICGSREGDFGGIGEVAGGPAA